MNNKSKYRIIYLDTAFTYRAIQERSLYQQIKCRDLEGFFEHVWSVHPFATLIDKNNKDKYGKIDIYNLDPSNTIIEGKVGYYKFLRFIPPINFIISQFHVLKYLFKLIKKNNINIIRSGDPLLLGIYSIILSKLCKIPYAIRINGNFDKIYEITRRPIMPKLFFFRRLEKLIEKFVIIKADLIIAPNKDNLNFALNNGANIKNSAIFRYGNLIDDEHFKENRLRNSAEGILKKYNLISKKFIIYIGRLEKVKHPMDVIKVLYNISNKNFNFKAVLIGDGVLKKFLIQEATNLDIEDKIVLMGNKDQNFIATILPHAFAVISPHTGRALAESALAGIPIVAYDIDWQSELIEHGVTGELVTFKDTEKMTNSLLKYINNAEYANKVSKNIRIKALNMFDKNMLNEYEKKIYKDILNRNNKIL